ncbi:MAG: 50S ribosomal protein L5 [Candidatus Collierbacteria bacterium GW2011_GWC2_43_12]|uniref:50S ribosomal protein L5 n=1 Tax=Candidatus Collierbacteria bacterium GW2011_GWC2_43_12 TaxID=1618390 RepID=A0A0G1D4M6_9BACT|nr:MAG: 50S ribosomal protein L5 [Candidatus Collierbacteria bacterium GW2011_GWC2_43_12]
MVMKRATIIVGLIGILVPAISSAHPGRTDSAGCHTCRTNCASWGLSTGEYHCHNAKAAPQPVEPVKSTYGANGTGYTTPAPEYKVNTANVGQKYAEPVSAVNTVNAEQKIKDRIAQEKAAYYKNPHWFRENLISRLEKEFGKSNSIGKYVYTVLADIK